MGDDPREWRVYKRRERFRAHQLPSGLGWEVEDESGKRSNYTNEDFRSLFETAACYGKTVDAEHGTVHYLTA